MKDRQGGGWLKHVLPSAPMRATGWNQFSRHQRLSGPAVKGILDAATSNESVVAKIKDVSQPLAGILDEVGAYLFPNVAPGLHIAAGAVAAFDPDVGLARARPTLIDNRSDSLAIEAKALQSVFWNTYSMRENEPDAKLSTQSQTSYTLVLISLPITTGRSERPTRVDPHVKAALEPFFQEPEPGVILSIDAKHMARWRVIASSETR